MKTKINQPFCGYIIFRQGSKVNMNRDNKHINPFFPDYMMIYSTDTKNIDNMMLRAEYPGMRCV